MLPVFIRLKKGVPPWEHPTWRNGRIKPLASPMIVQLIGALLCGFFGIAGILSGKVFRGSWSVLELLLGVFLVAALLLLIAAMHKGRHLIRYRGSEFVMNNMPGVIGGKLSGILYLNGDLPESNEIIVELVNLKQSPLKTGTGSDRSSSTISEREWVGRLHLHRHKLPGTADQKMIPVEFTIPYNTKDMTDRYYAKTARGHVNYLWMLYIYLTPDSSKAQLEFSVPVFRTADSNPAIGHSIVVSDDLNTLVDTIRREGHRPRVRLQPGLSQPLYIVSAWPGWGQFLPPLIISAVLLTVSASIARGVWHEVTKGLLWDGSTLEQVINVAIASVFGVAALLVPFLSMFVLFWLVQSITGRTFSVSENGLTLRRSFLGLVNTRLIPLERIKRIYAESSGMTSGRKFKRVKLNYAAGRKRKNAHICLADYIYSPTEAKWMVRELNKQVFLARKKIFAKA